MRPLLKPMQPDDLLAKVVGGSLLPRTELTKKLWAYICKNGLQDAKKRTLIMRRESEGRVRRQEAGEPVLSSTLLAFDSRMRLLIGAYSCPFGKNRLLVIIGLVGWPARC